MGQPHCASSRPHLCASAVIRFLTIVLFLTALLPARAFAAPPPPQRVYLPLVASPAPAAPPPASILAPAWYRANLNQAREIAVRDWDEDGAQEIFIFDFRNISAWRDTGEVELEQVWSAPVGGAWGFANLDADPAVELWVAHYDGLLQAYDPLSYTPVTLGNLGHNVTAARLVDFFGDGRLQFITATENARIQSYSWPGLLPTWESGSLDNCYSVYGQEDMVILQADADPRLEVALRCGHVLDPEVSGSEWRYNSGFWHIAAGNLDDDPYDELLSWDNGRLLTVFDVDRGTPAWQIVSPWQLKSVAVADALGDSRPEIIAGEDCCSHVAVYDTRTRAAAWERGSSVPGIDALGVGDPDGDGVRDLVWAAGGYNGGRLMVAPLTPTGANDPPAPQRAWGFDGDPYVATLQLDADPALEVVQFEPGKDRYFETTYRILDGVTGREQRGLSLDLADLNAKGRPLHLLQGDIDRDGQDELLLFSYDTVWLLDHDGRLLTKTAAPNDFYPRWLGDADRDGALEVVGHAFDRITALSLPSLEVKWNSIHWGEQIHGLDMADVDGDGKLEALFYAADKPVRSFELETQRLEWELSPHQQTRAVKVGDVNGKGRLEIIVVSSQGELEFYDPQTRELIRRGPKVAMGYGAPQILLERLTGSAAPQMIIVDNEISFFGSATDPRPAHSIRVGTSTASLRVADADADGHPDVLIGEFQRTQRLRALQAPAAD